MKRKSMSLIAVSTVALAAVGAAVYAQDKFDKYSLKSPSGIAFPT